MKCIKHPTMLPQRDLIAAYKKETCLNVSILSKIHSMQPELSRQIFNEDALEKPTQHVFIHLSYYLVCIIDRQKAASFTWPLYDSKSEKVYRNELALFVIEYTKTGLLSPVMSSYFVNPACFKVTKLIYQLSQLAVQRVLATKLTRDDQKELYDDITEKFTAGNKDFLSTIERETNFMQNKFSLYLKKREMLEKMSGMLKQKILENEDKIKQLQNENLIGNIVDKFLETNKNIDTELKIQIEAIKNINEPAPILDTFLTIMDKEIDLLETSWTGSMSDLLTVAHTCKNTCQNIIERHTGEGNTSNYSIEYKMNTLETEDLENEVNSEQKYILKNIIQDQMLSFPNLMRGYVVSICHIYKSINFDDVTHLNEWLGIEKRNYKEVVAAMESLLNRLSVVDDKLPQSQLCNYSTSKLSNIPPIPDLSDVKSSRELSFNAAFETFTPLNILKHQFNLRRKNITFAKPLAKPLMTPFHPPRSDFLQTLESCRRPTSYERRNVTQNSSILTQQIKINETIAECSSGFTKQQIQRLLSTKKGSSTKKNNFNPYRPKINVKKGGLFTDTADSSLLFRSHSSPNLYDNKERRNKKLSAMQGNIPPLMEVSGISIIENSSQENSPQVILDNPFESLPVMNLSNRSNESEETAKPSPSKYQEKLMEIMNQSHDRTLTPVSQQPVNKTSSIEKIINRFKKVRASVLADRNNSTEFRSIAEEKENLKPVIIDVYTANKVLLPDLLSPRFGVLPKKPKDFLEDLCLEVEELERGKPRMSLGTALGVDNTFLEQFEIVD